MKPFVSVVIPCRNEARFLPRCLDSILSGDYPADRMEVLAVDGSSSDGTRECIRSYAQRDGRVRLVENPQGTTPAALNRGIEAAHGDVIARVDAHAAVAREYFSRAVAHLETSGADNVGGTMRTLAQEDGPWAGAIVAALTHPFGVGNSYFRIGSGDPRWVDTVFGGCWRRQVFERVGRFNPELLRSQDLEFSLRLKAAGGRTLLAPDVRSDYYARARLGSFRRNNFLNGQWAILAFAYSPVIPVSLRHAIPLLLVLAVGAGAALLPWSRWPLAAVLLPYAAANLGATAHVAVTRRRIGYLARMPAAFGALHLGYGLGSVYGLIRAAGVLWKRGTRNPKGKTWLPQP